MAAPRITLGGVARAFGATPVSDGAQNLEQVILEARTRALAASLVEGLPTALWSFDHQGRVEIQNDAATRLRAIVLAEDPRNPGLVVEIGGMPFQTLLRAGEPQAWDVRSPCGNVSYQLRSHVVEIERIKRLCVVAIDVTRERAMLVRLADAERRAAVGVLGAGVAHEINNPLSFVLANVRCLGEYLGELAKLAGPAAESREILADAPQLLEETEHGLERIRVIVKELLHFSTRVTSGELPSTCVTLVDVVGQALRLAGHEFLRRGAHIVRSDRLAPEIVGSSHQLGDVVLDLLLNAVESVDGLPPERRRVEVRTYGAGRLAVLEIEDRGVGIPSHVMPRIFDPFFTTKTDRSASGLGLSIASEIVRRHGGEMVVTSREGEGTIVRVEIPGAQI